MKEEFIHYLWRYCLFTTDELRDQEGNIITVIHPGEYNRDGGPDFFNGRIIIGTTKWAGNIEIHTDASHWEAHGHHNDHKYDNVILHVVLRNNKQVYTASGLAVPTAEIKFREGIYDKYNTYLNKPCIIACEEDIRYINRQYLNQWLAGLLVERFEEKSANIAAVFAATGNDWEETLYRILARYFGFRVNTVPFELLASSLPRRIISKHANNRFQVEAMMFGVAGMLNEGLFRDALNDDYYRDLIREYRILASKYSLKAMHGWLWNFHRLRPSNFPTLRISQMAAFLSSEGNLFSKVIEASGYGVLKDIFRAASSDYWNDHYTFGKVSGQKNKNTGDQAIDILLINAVLPVIYTYGRVRGESAFREKAVNILDCMPPESNSIIREWNVAGIKATSAFFSQALIQLRNEYCKKRLCLSCRIGCRLIAEGRNLKEEHEILFEP